MTTLAIAIEKKEWDLVSLCLLVSVAEAAAALPPDAVEGLLEVLAGLEAEDAGPRAPTGARMGGGARRGRRR